MSTNKIAYWTVRTIAVFLVGCLWFYVVDHVDSAHGAVNSSVSVSDPVDGCHIPWSVANGGYNVRDWCRKHGHKPELDPKEKFIAKCGGGAVIATWFVRTGKVSTALGALAGCSWASLFEGHPAAKKRAVHKALAVRSRGVPSSRGMRAV